MITVNDITTDDFKGWFVRDFIYATPLGATEPVVSCQKNYITDPDLQRSFTEASINFNEKLFGEDDALRTTFYYLWAHYLVCDIQAASEGVNSSGKFITSSRSVGPLSESYVIPEWMLRDPNLAQFANTRYGQKYLGLIKPLLIGNVMVYQGDTTYR